MGLWVRVDARSSAILEETLAGEKMLAAASYGDRSIDFLQSA